MKPSKRNSIFSFIFAFLPGAAEMYMGFMKCGVSLLALFFITFAVPAVMYGGDIFFVLPAIIYVYGFFHARNLAKASAEDFVKIEDRFIWEEFMDGKEINLPEKTVRKWTAVILIVFGVCGIWFVTKEALCDILAKFLNKTEYAVFREIMEFIPQIVVAVLAIIFGVKLISGKKVELSVNEPAANNSVTDLSAKIIANAEEKITNSEVSTEKRTEDIKEGETDGTESDK